MKRCRGISASSLSLADWQLLHDSVLALLPSSELVERSCVRAAGGTTHVKVAAFDMDDTLIMPKSGAVFAKDDPGDWKWLLPVVPRYLRHLYDEKFMIVIISNQAGIGDKGWNEKKADAVKRKIMALIEELSMPLVVFLATKKDLWRKPNVDMWKMLRQCASTATLQDLSISNEVPGLVFYAGDAAGRKGLTLAGRKKDFGCSDRKFALNINVPFLTPEQLYRFPETELFEDKPLDEDNVVRVISSRLLSLAGEPCEVDWDGLSPSELSSFPSSYDNLTISRIRSDGLQDTFVLPSPAVFSRTTQEMVVFVGYPGSGKTTFFDRFLKPAGYVHISRDKLKTAKKCLSETKKSWDAGKSVVIDNTNPHHSDCMQFISIVDSSISGQTPLPVRIFHFKASKALSMHMTNFRARLGIGSRISEIVYNIYKSKYQEWTPSAVKSAKIEELLEIPFVAFFDGLPENAQEEFFLLS